MKTPAFWYRKNTFYAYLFYPFSVIWKVSSILRNLMIIPKEFNANIICVGNVIAGGGGKTPIIVKLAKLLKKEKPLESADITPLSFGDTFDDLNGANPIKIAEIM